MARNLTLLTDLYQLTMAQGYWQQLKPGIEACFYMFFRDNPFKGGYAVSCGMDQVVELIEGFGFDDGDIDYLAGLKAPSGAPLFDEAFLEWLGGMELEVDIDAVPDGTVVFPREPLLRVTGPLMQCQLLEAALLNCVNFQTLIATKAARVCLAAQDAPVAEFGLRRAQGAGGGLWASRASIVGGCASTSNVLAGKMFDLPVSGTHAHSWVMAFPSELEAFRAYAEAFPKNCTLLVDTYNVEQGIDNAITVGLEMRERGEKLSGIRIDSGDLAWLAKMARRKLDAAGLTDCGIVLSNDLDEYTIQSILEEGAQVSAWGVGTKLACAYDQPTLGGVYKLSATRKPGGEWIDHLKISESAKKLTFPGVLDVRRYYHEDGHIAGDMVFDTNAGVQECETIVDPLDSLRRKRLGGKRFETLLAPLARNGKTVLAPKFRDALAARERARAGLATLDESQKRMLNPHSYPVGLEHGLFEHRSDLVAKLRGF